MAISNAITELASRRESSSPPCNPAIESNLSRRQREVLVAVTLIDVPSTSSLSASAPPAGRPAKCEQCFDELNCYVELELADADADRLVRAVHAHQEGCPACDEDHKSLLGFVANKRGPPADHTITPGRRAPGLGSRIGAPADRRCGHGGRHMHP